MSPKNKPNHSNVLTTSFRRGGVFVPFSCPCEKRGNDLLHRCASRSAPAHVCFLAQKRDGLRFAPCDRNNATIPSSITTETICGKILNTRYSLLPTNYSLLYRRTSLITPTVLTTSLRRGGVFVHFPATVKTRQRPVAPLRIVFRVRARVLPRTKKRMVCDLPLATGTMRRFQALSPS